MKININYVEKVQAALDAEQGTCRTRLVDVEDINCAIVRAITKLKELEIPKKAWVGCSVHLSPEKVANSYKGIPTGTFVTVTCGATSWFVTWIRRGYSGSAPYGRGARESLELTDNAKASIPSIIRL